MVVEEPEDKLRLENNLYWGNGSPFQIQWGGRGYPSLEEWGRATGQEFSGGKMLGLFMDPRLHPCPVKRPGNDENWLARLAPYIPEHDSVTLTRGIAVVERTAMTQPSSDLLGRAIEPSRGGEQTDQCGRGALELRTERPGSPGRQSPPFLAVQDAGQPGQIAHCDRIGRRLGVIGVFLQA